MQRRWRVEETYLEMLSEGLPAVVLTIQPAVVSLSSLLVLSLSWGAVVVV